VATDAQGAPVSDLAVRVEPGTPPLGDPGSDASALGPLADRFTVRTNALGVAHLRGLPVACARYHAYLGEPLAQSLRVAFDASAAGTVRRVAVTLPRTATVAVTGRVTDVDGTPLADVAVRTPDSATSTGADGTYALELPRGQRRTQLTALRSGCARAATWI